MLKQSLAAKPSFISPHTPMVMHGSMFVMAIAKDQWTIRNGRAVPFRMKKAEYYSKSAASWRLCRRHCAA
jgi:hypothetical protein